jgi:DNA-binding IclR family transcriptional regulator
LVQGADVTEILTIDAAKNRPSPYQAPALEKGLDILELLAERTIPLATVEIAAALGRSRSEIYRMVVVLERHGYLRRGPDERFELDNRLFDIAMRAPPRRNLHDAAMPVMHTLAERLFQSCHLAVRSGNEMVVVGRVESPGLLGFAVRLGYRRPIMASTSGRILFALLPDDMRSALHQTISSAAASPAELEAFMADAKRVAAKGYHMGPSAFVDAVTDLGAPVFDGETPGAAASLVVPFVSGRSARCTIDDALAAVVEAAKTISSQLQHG